MARISQYSQKSTYTKTTEMQTKKSSKYNNFKNLYISVNGSGTLKTAAQVQIGDNNNKPIDAKEVYFGITNNVPKMVGCFSNCTCNTVCDCDQVSVCTCDTHCNCNTVQYCSCDKIYTCSCDDDCNDNPESCQCGCDGGDSKCDNCCQGG